MGIELIGADVGDEWAIEVNNLSFAYSAGHAVLEGVSLQVARGQTVGLVGPNGAGKTTLFLCLSGVLPVRAGAICVGGLDPAVHADRSQLPARVGIVFQNTDDQIFNATVFDEVAFGPLNLGLPADEVRQRVADALSAVGMAGSEEAVPFHLSGGEKRRIALASVLAMTPDILLLDEPTIFLDPRGRREFLKLLGRVPATKLIATHDLEMVLDTCQRVLLLDQGRLVAAGTPELVLSDAALMEAHGLEVPYRLRRG
jgi:cobalt/nickel transport system ATP-binding protein